MHKKTTNSGFFINNIIGVVGEYCKEQEDYYGRAKLSQETSKI